jgi:hypothetical protein
MVPKIVYVKAVLFFIILFIAGLNLLIFFFGGVVGSLLTKNYLLFLGGLFYFFIFLVMAFIAKRLEPAWEEVQARLGLKPKPKTIREGLKETLPLVAIYLVAIANGILVDWYFGLFPSVISKELAREIVRSILTIDGILLGFYGVILAQFLWAIHSKGNLIYEQMIACRTDNDVIAHLNEEASRLGKDRLLVVTGMFYAAMPILASFLLCLTKLPLTEGNDTISPRTVMYDPVTALITGIILLVIVALAANLLPKRVQWPAQVEASP